MVILILSAIDQQGNLREFSCQVSSIDRGFDVLSELAAKGHILINARLLEEGQWTELPLEAFNENLVSPILKQLETDWQQILGKPGYLV